MALAFGRQRMNDDRAVFDLLSFFQGRDQRAWADLVKARGRQVNYSIIQSTFHQIVADAFQRMVLRNTTPEEAYQEVVTKYNEALAKAK